MKWLLRSPRDRAFSALIEGSTLGTPGCTGLWELTPPIVRARIVEASLRLGDANDAAQAAVAERNQLTATRVFVDLASIVANQIIPSDAIFELASLKEGDSAGSHEFVEAFQGELESWFRTQLLTSTPLGTSFVGWQERLLALLAADDYMSPSNPDVALELLVAVLFGHVANSPFYAGHAGVARRVATDLSAEVTRLVGRAARKAGLDVINALTQRRLCQLEAELEAAGIAGSPRARRILLAVYLTGLLEELDRDPWTRRAGDHALLSTIRRPLRVETRQRSRFKQLFSGASQTVDSDELFDLTHRFVLLGEAGSGKTWTARWWVIRAATRAIRALNLRAPLGTIEIPLFAQCSGLDGGTGRALWRGIVGQSLERSVAVAGNAARMAEALQSCARVLIVLDGLDEFETLGSGALDQLVSLPGSARLVATCRPTAWRGQVTIDVNDPRHAVGSLCRFTEDDVANVVESWVSPDQRRTKELLGELTSVPGLAEHVTSPLLCAMFCLASERRLASGDRPDLFEVVASQSLARFDLAGLERPDFPRLSRPTATPNRKPGTAGQMKTSTGRRIPSIRRADERQESREGRLRAEVIGQIVARRFARLSVKDAAYAMVPWLWFDKNWHDIVPAVVAAHPHAAELLRELVDGVRNATDDPTEVERALLDRCAPVARRGTLTPETRDLTRETEGTATDDHTWDIDVPAVRLIDLQPCDAAKLADAVTRFPRLVESARVFTELMADASSAGKAEVLTEVVARLALAEDETVEAGQVLVNMVNRAESPSQVAEAVQRLAESAEDKAEASRTLVGRILSVATLEPHTDDLVAVMTGLTRTTS